MNILKNLVIALLLFWTLSIFVRGDIIWFEVLFVMGLWVVIISLWLVRSGKRGDVPVTARKKLKYFSLICSFCATAVLYLPVLIKTIGGESTEIMGTIGMWWIVFTLVYVAIYIVGTLILKIGYLFHKTPAA